MPNRNWGTLSTFCFSPWAFHKTDSLPIPPVLLPVSGVSDAVLKPYALLNSSRILPSHPIPAGHCWPRTLGCREGGLPASCVGSKYLHSPSSRVARWRGLDVLGYVKSSPPGCIFNRLSLLEQIPWADSLWRKFSHLPDTDRDTKATPQSNSVVEAGTLWICLQNNASSHNLLCEQQGSVTYWERHRRRSSQTESRGNQSKWRIFREQQWKQIRLVQQTRPYATQMVESLNTVAEEAEQR